MKKIIDEEYICITNITDNMIILDKGQIVYIDYCNRTDNDGISKYRIYEIIGDGLPLYEHKWWGNDSTFEQYFMPLAEYQKKIRKDKLERLNQISKK